MKYRVNLKGTSDWRKRKNGGGGKTLGPKSIHQQGHLTRPTLPGTEGRREGKHHRKTRQQIEANEKTR